MNTQSLFDVISYCSYTNDNKNKVIEKIFELCDEDSDFEIFQRKLNDIGYIFIIKRFTLVVRSVEYQIRIVCHLLPGYPSSAPEVFILFEGSFFNQLIVNEMISCVNKETAQVKPHSLLFYNEHKKLKEIFTEIHKAFNEHFPLLRSKEKKTVIKSTNMNMIDFNSAIRVMINDSKFDQIKFINNSVSNVNSLQDTNKNKINTFQTQPINEKELKQILINEIIFTSLSKYKIALEDKVKENLQLKVIVKNLEALISQKKIYLQKQENNFNFVNKSLSNINSYVTEATNDNSLAVEDYNSLDSLLDFLKVSSKHKALLNFAAIELIYEELVLILRKCFDKKIISFDLSLKIIRHLSKCIAVVQYKKVINNS